MSFYNHPFEFSRHNAFRSFHLYSTMPKYWESYRQQYNRLRRYVPKPTGSPISNSLAIRNLQRQINKQKPELQHDVVLNTTSFNASELAGFSLWNITPSENLAADPDRGEKILGDSWVNKSLELRFSTDIVLGFQGDIRLVIYIPKKAGTAWVPSSMTDFVDPNFATVLHDEIMRPTWTPDDHNTENGPHYTFMRKVGLGNRISTFIGTTPEKNNIRVAFLNHGRASTSTTPPLIRPVSCRHRLTYTNK